jgi:hypothetical protein
MATGPDSARLAGTSSRILTHSIWKHFNICLDEGEREPERGIGSRLALYSHLPASLRSEIVGVCMDIK